MDQLTPILGLPEGDFFLSDWSPEWSRLFEEEKRRITDALGNMILDVQHVGSTSVPGLSAKPILDIAIGLANLSDAERCKGPLETLGYEHAHWAGIDDQYVFAKGVERTHLIHAVEFKGPLWANYLRFRDALRRSAKLRSEYEILKADLSQQFADRRAAYTERKGDFIRRVLAETIV